MTRLIPITFIAALIIVCSCRGTHSAIPVVTVDLKQGSSLITNWRISGPFKLPENKQVYTQSGLQEAFDHDYLTEIDGKETPLTMPKPATNVAVDFTRDPNDYPDFGPTQVQFIDQIQQFPTPAVNTQVLFRKAGEFFKITYGAAILASEIDTEVALLVSGNSPLKIWLNDKEILQSPASIVGHDPDVLHVLMVPLKKGDNNLLVKMFCFPKRNEFVVRVATRKWALDFVREHGGLRDVVEEAIVPPGQPLLLSHNLPFFSSSERVEARVEITDSNGRNLLNSVMDLSSRTEIETPGFARGLYTIKVSIDDWVFSQNFYIGERDKITAAYEQRCSERKRSGEHPDVCATMEHLRKIESHTRSSFRLDWQKSALFLLEQLEWGLAGSPGNASFKPATLGPSVFAYRSRIDGEKQYYFFHLPKSYEGQSVPLVIVNPHNTVQKPLLASPVATKPDWLRKLTTFADEFGYATLWPQARGRNNNVHLALADTLEALEDVQRRFAIDADRIYLAGDCGGARNALLFAQRFPDRIAAVSVLNSATTSGLFANPSWQESNNPRAAVGNLLNIPLQLIHGDFFPHSPVQQSIELRDAARGVGMDPELVLLPGDSRWADRDPFRLSFAFFQGKTRQTPKAVSLATGQLKYGSAYWLRITELATPPSLGMVKANFNAPGKIVAHVSNISELELVPSRFPEEVRNSETLEIDINGTVHTVSVKNGEPVKVRILEVDHDVDVDGVFKKTTRLEGPVSHAFAESFVIVQATGGSEADQELSKRLADQIQKSWQDNYYVSCPRKTDHEITSQDIATMNLVIAGGPNVNATIKRIFGSLPFELDAGGIRVGDMKVESSQALVSAIYPNPLNPQRYVVLVASNSPNAAELPAPELARSGSYDVAVWRFDTNKQSQLLGEWYWDRSWRRLTLAGAVTQDPGGVEVE